jgi:Recombinase
VGVRYGSAEAAQRWAAYQGALKPSYWLSSAGRCELAMYRETRKAGTGPEAESSEQPESLRVPGDEWKQDSGKAKAMQSAAMENAPAGSDNPLSPLPKPEPYPVHDEATHRAVGLVVEKVEKVAELLRPPAKPVSLTDADRYILTVLDAHRGKALTYFQMQVNPEEAGRVRAIFALYLEHEALLPVVQELERRGWVNKCWTTRSEKVAGGVPFTKTSLHRLLTNVVYAGKVRYKQEVHPGEHEALVDETTWQRVQDLLQTHGRTSGPLLHHRCGALLQGLVRCAPCA